MIAPPTNIDEGVQANLPPPDHEDETLKIRGLERIKLYPKVPPEPSTYGKYSNFSRQWILQDGRGIPGQGSEARDAYTTPKGPTRMEGIRKRMLRNFFWEQMLDEMIEDMKTAQPNTDICSEYESNYTKDNFQPRNLAFTADKNMHLKYPLYGTGSSAITFYSETVRKTGEFEILEPFRRCQYFTRPMEERLDDGWVL